MDVDVDVDVGVEDVDVEDADEDLGNPNPAAARSFRLRDGGLLKNGSTVDGEGDWVRSPSSLSPPDIL